MPDSCQTGYCLGIDTVCCVNIAAVKLIHTLCTPRDHIYDVLPTVNSVNSVHKKYTQQAAAFDGQFNYCVLALND